MPKRLQLQANDHGIKTVYRRTLGYHGRLSCITPAQLLYNEIDKHNPDYDHFLLLSQSLCITGAGLIFRINHQYYSFVFYNC
jgi:hypothetical protein